MNSGLSSPSANGTRFGVVGSSREDERNHEAENGDREKAAKAREGRVDSGSETRVAPRRGRERRRGDWCDDHREPQAVENEARQETVHETPVVDSKPEQHPRGHHHRPHDQECSRAVSIGRPPEASSKEKDHGGRGKEKQARLKRGVAHDRLQEENEEERRAGDGAVDEERGDVDEGEVVGCERARAAERVACPSARAR